MTSGASQKRGQKARSAGPLLVLIAGGSGSGKTWLAAELAKTLGPKVTRISLDDFYRDRSHLSAARRARVNFDRPSAIDWGLLEACVEKLLARQVAISPVYDFQTHSRMKFRRLLKPRQIIVIDGLWVLRRRWLRERARMKVFITCPAALRLSRRLARDLTQRGRTRISIEEQFRKCVEPMHRLFVEGQVQHADVVLEPGFTRVAVRQLARQIAACLTGC